MCRNKVGVKIYKQWSRMVSLCKMMHPVVVLEKAELIGFCVSSGT